MKKFLNIILLLIIFVSTISISISYFKFEDTNTKNYIEIGSISPKDISTFLYFAVGPALTFKGEIPNPVNNSYDWTRKLSDYPYFDWAKHRKNNILDIILNNNGIIPKSNPYFAKQKDHLFLERNSMYFDITKTNTFFHNNRGPHLFVAIYNNSHLTPTQKHKKINVYTEKNLNIEANVTFQGTRHGTILKTNYNNNVDIYNKRYYITTAYRYSVENKNFVELKRGSWYFYNNADLVIIDLGSTGYIEEKWVHNPIKSSTRLEDYSIPVPQLQIDLEQNNEQQAKIIKADYTVTFTPSWEPSKAFKQSINLE